MLRTCDLIKWLHPYMNAARTWAAWYNTWLLIKLTPKVLSFLSFLKAATDVTQGQRPPAVPSQLRLRKAVWQTMVPASQMHLWHSPCQRTPLGCILVSHVSAYWQGI